MSESILQKIVKIDDIFGRLTGFQYISSVFQANKNLLLYLLLIGLVGYAGDVVNFSLNIDSENHAYAYGAKGAWASQGRWGMYLLNAALLPDAIMPVIPTLIAIVGLAVGALFFVKTLSSSRGLADYLAGSIAIVCPTLYFALYFTTLGYGIGVAFALTCFGMFMLTQWTRIGFVVAALCFSFGISIYQAVLPLIFALFGLYMVSVVIEQQNVEFRVMIRRCAVFLLAIVVGYIVYDVIKRWSLYYLKVGFDTGYIGGFVNFKPSWGYLADAFEKTWPIGVAYYTGGKDYYLYDLRSLQILFFLTLAISLFRILFAKNSWAIRLCGVLCLLLAIAAPIAMHFMNAGYMPPRTVLGVSQVLAALIFYSLFIPSRIVKTLVVVLTVSCIYNFCVVNNRYAFSNAMSWQADRELSVQIQQRIAEVLPKITKNIAAGDVYPLELVGWVDPAQTPIFVNREVIGASFYKWGAGDVERIERLFKTMGVHRYRAAKPEERLSLVEKAQGMPNWPYPGSVDVINGVIVVKFREYNNPNQFLAMCRPPFNKHPVCIKYLPQ